jgi:hypothetical protein
MATIVSGKGWQCRGQGRVRVARAARAKAIAMRVVGDAEGDSKGGKDDGDGNEVMGNNEGNCEHHL